MGGGKDKNALWKNPNHEKGHKISANDSIPSSATANKKVTSDDETIPKLKSALKGPHTRRTKLRVKWAPDVYDPPASLDTKTRRTPSGALVLRTFNTSTVAWETGGPSGESIKKGGPSGESDKKRSNTNGYKPLSNSSIAIFKGLDSCFCSEEGCADSDRDWTYTTENKQFIQRHKLISLFCSSVSLMYLQFLKRPCAILTEIHQFLVTAGTIIRWKI